MSNVSHLQNAHAILARPTGNSRNADKFVVRLPDGMREKIARVARTHHRSMNSEIIDTLETHMTLVDMGHGPLIERLLQGGVAGDVPVVKSTERVRAGDPAFYGDSVWIVEKLEVKANVVYANISRESPANSMPESKTVRYSLLTAFAE